MITALDVSRLERHHSSVSSPRPSRREPGWAVLALQVLRQHFRSLRSLLRGPLPLLAVDLVLKRKFTGYKSRLGREKMLLRIKENAARNTALVTLPRFI